MRTRVEHNSRGRAFVWTIGILLLVSAGCSDVRHNNGDGEVKDTDTQRETQGTAAGETGVSLDTNSKSETLPIRDAASGTETKHLDSGGDVASSDGWQSEATDARLAINNTSDSGQGTETSSDTFGGAGLDSASVFADSDVSADTASDTAIDTAQEAALGARTDSGADTANDTDTRTDTSHDADNATFADAGVDAATEIDAVGDAEHDLPTCETLTCGDNGKCVDAIGGAYCECNAGWTGADCQTCRHACGMGQTCIASGCLPYISSKRSFTCAVLSTGDVKCWGWNGTGCLGIGDTVNRGDNAGDMDTLPAVDLGGNNRAIQVAVGGRHACALLESGEVKCWGANFLGELGQGRANTVVGDEAGQMGNNLPATDLGPDAQDKQLALAGQFSCALLTDGRIKCWGANPNGNLGLGNTNPVGTAPNHMGANLAAVFLGAGRSAVSISAGETHVCAVLDKCPSASLPFD